jgi:hypothetical protein
VLTLLILLPRIWPGQHNCGRAVVVRCGGRLRDAVTRRPARSPPLANVYLIAAAVGAAAGGVLLAILWLLIAGIGMRLRVPSYRWWFWAATVFYCLHGSVRACGIVPQSAAQPAVGRLAA